MDLKNRENICKIIREFREKKKITQDEMAKKLGMSYRSYQRIEHGETPLRLDTYLNILAILDLEFLCALLQKKLCCCSTKDKPKNTVDWSKRSISRKEPFVSFDAIKALESFITENHEKHSIKIGYWDWDLESESFFWCPQMYEIYEIDSNTPGDPEILLNKIHPADAAKIQNDMEDLINNGQLYFNSHRIVLANKNEKIVNSLASVFFDENKKKTIYGLAYRLD